GLGVRRHSRLLASVGVSVRGRAGRGGEGLGLRLDAVGELVAPGLGRPRRRGAGRTACGLRQAGARPAGLLGGGPAQGGRGGGGVWRTTGAGWITRSTAG